MTRALSHVALAALAAASVSVSASAAAPAPASAPASARAAAPAPALSSIAAAAFPELPDLSGAPASIAADERIDGLTLSAAPFGPDTVQVQATDGQCLRGPTDWGDPLERPHGNASTWVRAAAPVLPIRLERLVRAEAGVALEIADVWVDPRSRGARLGRVARLPLTAIGRGPGDFAVHGVRVGSALHVVAPTEERGVVRASAGELQTVECRHLRVILDAPGPGEGAMVQLAAFPRAEPPPAPSVEPLPSQRTPLAITVSLTQISRDPSPVLSVRVAWARATPIGAPPRHIPGILVD